jgi:hypothetical protein
MFGHISLRGGTFSDMTVGRLYQIVVLKRAGYHSSLPIAIAPDRVWEGSVGEWAHAKSDSVDTHHRRKRVIHARRQCSYGDFRDLQKRERSVLMRCASSPESEGRTYISGAVLFKGRATKN